MYICKSIILTQQEASGFFVPPDKDKPSLEGEGITTKEWVDIGSCEDIYLSSIYRLKVAFADLVYTESKGYTTANLVFIANQQLDKSYFGNSNYHVDGNKLIIDVTDYVFGNQKRQELFVSCISTQTLTFYGMSNQTDYPYLLFSNSEDKGIKKILPLVDKATCAVALKTGEIQAGAELIASQNSVHGIGVDLIATKDGLKLNLEELFDGNVWTDAYGNTQTVKEKFYYKKDGHKCFVEANEVSANPDGRYFYEDEGKIYDVIREESFADGTVAITEVKSVKHAKLLDTRSNELKQVQERLKSYDDAVRDFVVWKSGNTFTQIIAEQDTQPDLANKDSIYEVEKALSEGYHLSTKGEFFQIAQTSEQLKAIYDKYSEPESVDYVYKLNNAMNTSDENFANYSEFQLRFNVAEINKTLSRYYADYVQSSSPCNDITTLINLNNINFAEEVMWHKDYVAPNKDNPYPTNEFSPYFITAQDIKRLIYNRNACIIQIAKLQEDRQRQDKVLEAQLEYYKSLGEGYFEQLQNIFKEYYALKEKEQEILNNTPVRYIRGGETFKGFNGQGQLIILFKSDKIYASVNRDKNGKIISMTDEKNNSVLFKYRDEVLEALADVRGRNVFISYGEYIALITYPDASELKITYLTQDSVFRVQSFEKDGIIAQITYTEEGTLTQIARFSGQTQKDFAKLTIEEDKITLDNYDKSQEVYTLFLGEIEKEYLLKGGIVVDAIKQTTILSNATHVKKTVQTSYPTKASLYGDISSVDFVGDSQIDEVDCDGNVICTLVTDTKKSISTQRIFDDKNQCLKEVATVTYVGQTPYVIITEHNYNSLGLKVKTVSYVEGEEQLNGKTVEEWVYNEQGALLKAYTYNTLDSSSKFYSSEQIYNAKGECFASVDQTGEHKTEIEYVDKTSLIKSHKTVGGTTFAYGYDLADRVTAITQSTEGGEENSTQRVYQNGLLTKLVSGNTVIEYTYDAKRRITTVSVNGQEEYIKYTYEDIFNGNSTVVGEKITTEYKNGDKFVTETDTCHNLLKYTVKGTSQIENTYNNKKQLNILKDLVANKQYKINLKEDGKIERIYACDQSQRPILAGFSETYTYDDYGNVTQKTIAGPLSQAYEYSYKADSSRTLNNVTIGSISIKPQTDVLGRNKGKEIYYENSKIAQEDISYIKAGDHATILPSTIWYGNKKSDSYRLQDNLKYVYDKQGNIQRIYENGEMAVRYQYDAIGRLVREDNKALDKTCVFMYDNNGNILKRKDYAYTLKDDLALEDLPFILSEYEYDGDRLLSYNGATCEYNNVSNPTSYIGKSITWANAKQISKYDNISFGYDGQGRRITKGSLSFVYDAEGNLIEQSGANVELNLEFFYDQTGVAGFNQNGTPYFYRKDAQGNIIAILNDSGNIVAKYHYDAWGNHKVYNNNGVEITDTTHIGHLNPIRYRGYYFDKEFGFYYLKSRYYDPSVGRFVSPDSIEYLDPQSINGLNLYAYCGNDPINKYDPSGHFGIWAIIGIVGAAILLGGGAQLASNALAGETGSDLWRGVAGAALGSGVNALALCLSPFTGGASLAFAAGLGAAVQTGVDTLETVIRGETVNGWQTVADLGINFVTTFAGNWLGSKLIPTNSGWFQPKKFLSVFMKPYGQKILLQTSIGAGLSGIVNFARKFDWSSVDWKKIVPVIPVPMVPMYPLY